MITTCESIHLNSTPTPAALDIDQFDEATQAWKARLQAGLEQSIHASQETLGHIEERVLRETREVQRQVVEKAAQAKADGIPPLCPYCGAKLSRVTHGHGCTFESRFGPITMARSRGWCRRCHKWRFPADAVLGLEETGGCSPSVQEMAALGVSKMPAAEASLVIERLAGVKISVSTLEREARRQGQRAEEQRRQLDEKMRRTEGRAQQVGDLQMELPLVPFTLVIQMDAWNIRERDDWGQSAAQRAAGREPARWHWVYGGTCFRLSQRVKTASGRPMILSRGYVMTRGGVDALGEQLRAEALRHGLGQAADVLVIADGAVWIWNLAEDCFGQARQRLDAYHAKEHLWSVAEALHGAGTPAAKAWVQPLLRKTDQSQVLPMIEDLRQLLPGLADSLQATVQREINYFATHQNRMDYKHGRKRGEPIGSGAIESTCRQYQCRFKRPGQFWTKIGDEALMCLETFWRNDRWHLIFPHASFNPSKN